MNVNIDREAIRTALRAAWLTPGRPEEIATVPESLLRELILTRFADPAWVERL